MKASEFTDISTLCPSVVFFGDRILGHEECINVAIDEPRVSLGSLSSCANVWYKMMPPPSYVSWFMLPHPGYTLHKPNSSLSYYVYQLSDSELYQKLRSCNSNMVFMVLIMFDYV